jgi:hypothetical protein
MHNAPLLAIAKIVLNSGMDLQAQHIEGKKNIRTHSLSHLLLDDYQHKFPSDCIHFFTPPKELLAAQWRECF